MNRLLKKLKSGCKKIKVCLDIKSDLHWFISFLNKFNGVVYFMHDKTESHVYVDASLTGFGAHYGNNVYSVSRPIFTAQ